MGGDGEKEGEIAMRTRETKIIDSDSGEITRSFETIGDDPFTEIKQCIRWIKLYQARIEQLLEVLQRK